MTTPPQALRVGVMKRLIMGGLALLCFWVLLFSGCAIPDNTAEMWTNQPELAAYADEFNASQSTYRVKIVYREDPAGDLLGAPVVPDLVLARGLNSSRFDAILSDLSVFFKPGKEILDKEDFYQDLLALGRKEALQLTLPVSFNIPAFYYRKGSIPDEQHQRLLSLQDLREAVEQFNNTSSPSFPVSGFSPRWYGNYLYNQAVLKGVDFRETRGLSIAWNQTALAEVKEENREWIDGLNGGLENDRRFAEKYLYQPGFKVINNGRILLHPTTVRDFYSIPSRERTNLDLLWITDGHTIPVSSDVLFAGIPKNGEDVEAARAFLGWLLQADVQVKLLETAQFRRIRSFGIAQGFSSLIKVNELSYPLYYPLLVGNMPTQAELRFPEPLPREWERVKNEVIIPWLMKNGSPEGAGETLEKALEEWYLTNPGLRR